MAWLLRLVRRFRYGPCREQLHPEDFAPGEPAFYCCVLHDGHEGIHVTYIDGEPVEFYP